VPIGFPAMQSPVVPRRPGLGVPANGRWALGCFVCSVGLPLLHLLGIPVLQSSEHQVTSSTGLAAYLGRCANQNSGPVGHLLPGRTSLLQAARARRRAPCRVRVRSTKYSTVRGEQTGRCGASEVVRPGEKYCAKYGVL
jgi:hypothetical protein